MKKTIQLVFSLVLALPASGQQVASVDLRRPASVAEIPKNTEDTESSGVCEKTSLGKIIDGFTQSDDKQPRPIRVAFIDEGSLRLQPGSQLEAAVQLLNSGEKPIDIPWSTDWETTVTGQDPNARYWTVGVFQVQLKGKEHETELKGQSRIFYGSKFVIGSTLTLKPGEWITARISFVVETVHPEYEQIDEGDAELSVEWFQTSRSRAAKDCRVSQGYFPFRSYEQDNPPVSVRVVKNQPGKHKKAVRQRGSRP